MLVLWNARLVNIHLKLVVIAAIGRHTHTSSAGLPETGRIARLGGCRIEVAAAVAIRVAPVHGRESPDRRTGRAETSAQALRRLIPSKPAVL